MSDILGLSQVTLKKPKNVKHSVSVLFQPTATGKPQDYFGLLLGSGKASSSPKATGFWTFWPTPH